MRTRIVAVLAALMLVLAGCAGLPTAGSVNPGLALGEAPDVPDFSFLPNRPQPGATPEQIVEGFVAAATSPAGNWEIAQLFLAPDFSAEWRPETGVTIDRPGSRTITVVDADTVQMTVSQTGDVDETGAFHASEAGTSTLDYELEQQQDGEWRISAAPDGVVLNEQDFRVVFDAYGVMFFDPRWQFLVPDMRWFPTRQNVATRITQAIIGGTPSPWLSRAVVSAVVEGVDLRDSVPIVQGIAQVELGAAALEADPVTLGRLLRQLQASLQGTGVAGVELLVDGTELAVQPAQTLSTAVDARPLVQTAEDFGFLGEDALTTLPGLSRRISEIDADSIAVGRGGRVAAVLLAAGGVVRVEANEPTIADDRRGLIDPAIDPDDRIWTVPESQPAALTVSNAESEPAPIANAWPGATEIAAMQVSRDGTRIAAIVTEGGRDWVSVAGVERNGDGVPVALGTPERLLHPDGVGVDIAWLDDRTLGIIWEGTDGMIVTEQVVGGVSTSGDGPTGSAVSLAAGPTASSARLLTAEGALYVRRGTTWQRAAEDVLVLASQLGAN
ncbi:MULTISPECIES: LpqB family beta-propeller domain-containing protein [Bacteria]